MLKAFGVFVFLLFLSADVMAQPRQYEIYFDVDNSSGSGCQVLHAGLPDINGIESKVTIETNNQPPSIVSTTLSHCAGLVFDAGVAITPAALGFNTGDFGEDVLEAVLSQPELNIFSSGTVRVYFATGSNSAEDVVLVQASGDPVLLGFLFPIAIPTLGLLSILFLIVAFFLIGRFKLPRSFSVMIVLLAISPAVWAMTIIIDGQTGDWSGLSPSATDPAGDTSQSGSFADITSVYALNADDMIYLRMDIVDLENQAPVANDGLETTLEDTLVTLTLTGSDAEGDAITFSVSSPPVSGTLSTITVIDAVSSSVDYTPNGDFFGSDSFTFVANDGQASLVPATFEITVDAVNDPPSFTTGGDVDLVEDTGPYNQIWATAVSAGPANESGQSLTFNITANDNAAIFATLPSIDPAGVLSFAGVANTFGVANITVELQDDGGTLNGGDDTSIAVNFSISLVGVNDEPSFTVGSDQILNEDAGNQTINGWATALSSGPADESGQVLSFNITNNTNPSLFSAGPLVDGNTGDLTYTTTADANGSAIISLNIQDNGGTANGGVDTSATQSFTITVNPVNDMPSFITGGDVTVDEDSPAYSNAWATALLAGPADESSQTLSFNVVSVSDASLFSASPVVDAAGNLTFTPAVGIFGASTVTLNIMDNGLTANGGVDTSTPDVSFDINITEVNDAPVLAVIGAQSIDELQQLAFIATATDTNTPAQNLSFSLSGEPTGATITAGGNFTWTPTESQGNVGSFTFDVVVTDDGTNPTNLTDSETIIVTVNKVNAAPVLANIGAQSIDELTQLTFTATATDTDLPVQSLNFSLSGAVPSGASITAGGVFTWTPTEAQGADVYTFNVIVTDNGTNPANLTDLETITVTVNEVNTAPVLAAIGNQSIDEETLLSFTAVAADSDLPAQSLTFSLSGQPAGASITAGGLFTWTPTEVQGPGMYPFSVVVTDNGTGTLSDSETINVTVIEVNAAPVADAQSTTTDDATPLLITLTGSDSEASALTFSIVAGPATGSLGAITPLTPTSASVTYTPGTAGNNSFTFRVNDGSLNSSAATVTLNVSLSNQAPSAGADSYETIGNTGLHATTGVASTPIRHPNNVLVNDTDPDLDVLVVSALGVDTVAPFTGMTTLGGDVIMQVNGDFTYYPPAGVTSMLDTFMYTANDQNGGTSVGNVSITITSDLVYYVDNTAPAGGNGRDNSRFDQLSDIPAASANSTVYVFQGAGNTAGAITMGNNQRMLGSGVNLEFDVNNTLANPDVLFAASVRPILSGGTTLGLNNTVAGLNFNTNSVAAINGANVGGLILNNVDVTVNGGTQGISLGQANAMSNIVFGVINITNTSSQGINLSNNTASVINFDGNLVINNTTGTGFNAIGGGTINITATGNSIVTTTAIAVNIDNTNIGTSNVTFQSISSNGGNTGINLNTVGGTGSFNVTGTGTTSGSGGTIQNKTSNGILVQSGNNINLSNMNFTNATTIDTGAANSNAALEFNTAVNVNLDNLNLTGHLEHGILGVSVTNLDISNTTINGTGADTETNEHGIFITNLLGSGGAASVFDNLVINDSQDTAIRIINSTSTALVTIQNSTISNAGDTGINFITSNAAANLTGNVTGSTITNTVDGVSYESQAGALIGTVGGAGALSNTIAAGSNGDMVSGILFFANGPGLATVNGTANNNFITLDAVKIGGVAPVSGLNGVGIATGGMGTVRATVSNNTINSSFSGVLSQTVHGVLASNEGTGTTAQNVIMINNNSITLNPAVGTATAETVGIGVDGGLNGGGMTVRSIDNTIIATGDASNGASVGVQILPTEFGDPNNTNSRVCIGFTGNNISTPNNPFAAAFLTGELDVIAAPVALGSFLDVENSPLSVRTPAQLVMDLDAPLNTAEIGDATGSISGVITGVATCPF